jgi:two-component system response regulator YesN
MKMSWYHRMLLSYAPLFFVVISVLIFSFFSILNNSAQKQIAMTDDSIATKVMQAVDANLKASEQMTIKEIFTDEKLKDFYTYAAGDKTLFDYFVISHKLDDFSSMLPFSSSIYMYNEQSGKILSRNGLSDLDQFGDRDFLLAAYQSRTSPPGWTSPRSYREFIHDSSEEQVVSLVKFFPIDGIKQGAVVVNIRVRSLVGFMKDLTRYDAGFIRLLTSNLEPFDRSLALQSQTTSVQELKRKQIHSDYTGWLYMPGGQRDRKLSFMSQFNDLWIIVGIATIIIGVFWFTYITHRHYKPIQSIAVRINDYTKRKSSELVKHAGIDELKFIELAIDNLLEKTSQYEKLHNDDLLIRRRQVLVDWLEGHRIMNETEWKQETARLQLPSQFNRLAVAMMEIDRYSHFISDYSSSDQYLLKFVVSNVLQEVAQNEGIFAWNEWVEPQQMAVLFYLNDRQEQDENTVYDFMKKLQDWILANLEFTVSVGIGPETHTLGHIPQSYAEAKKHLSYKPVFGLGSLIGSRDVHAKTEGRIFPHLQSVRIIVKSFRTDDGQWQTHMTSLFHALKKGRFSQSDINHISNYFMYHLNKELMEMTGEAQELWTTEYKPVLEALVEHSEKLEEWHERLVMLLSELEPRVRAARYARNNHELICQVKVYIETHYVDSDLSLNRISDHFEMNPRYLSKLFKEEFGEKFIDYLLRIRLEEAQRLLLKTDLSVQHIAERVGYVHVISFHRAFKNVVGVPPGDFRKKTEVNSLQ